MQRSSAKAVGGGSNSAAPHLNFLFSEDGGVQTGLTVAEFRFWEQGERESTEEEGLLPEGESLLLLTR
jgi:hypothetical protein